LRALPPFNDQIRILRGLDDLLNAGIRKIALARPDEELMLIEARKRFETVQAYAHLFKERFEAEPFGSEKGVIETTQAPQASLDTAPKVHTQTPLLEDSAHITAYRIASQP
jgi:hypothetical protein